MENSKFSSQTSNESFDVIAWLRDFGEVNSIQENKHNSRMEEFESFYSSLCLLNGQDIRQNVTENMICQPMDSMDQRCYVQELSTTSSDPTIDSINEWYYAPEVRTTSIDPFPLKILDNNQCDPKKFTEANLHRDVNRGSIPIADVLRLAGERFLQFSSQRLDGLSMFIHPYGSAFSELSLQETREVELMHTLFLAADEVASCEFVVASELIGRCRSKASSTGNPVERLVFYFSESLQDRIKSGTGWISATRMNESIKHAKRLGLGDQPEFIAMQKCLPFSQVVQMVGIQEIIENVKSASKIHLIDLEIRSGVQWIGLLQALSQRRDTKLEVKITAIVTANREKIEATAKRLLSYAGSLNLPLSFKLLFASDMSEIKKEHFRTKADETVVVYGSSVLRSMVSRPHCLDNLMKVIRTLNPSLMVVAEIEANHNSQSFLHRFVESLFFYGAVFDCLDDCMERDDQLRLTLEGTQFGQGIQNTIATEGEQRVTRNVKLDVWRTFFRRFWMEEVELCESSLVQGNLVRKQYARGDSCSIERNGKGIIVGWKGTPILSLTTWKFLRFDPLQPC